MVTTIEGFHCKTVFYTQTTQPSYPHVSANVTLVTRHVVVIATTTRSAARLGAIIIMLKRGGGA